MNRTNDLTEINEIYTRLMLQILEKTTNKDRKEILLISMLYYFTYTYIIINNISEKYMYVIIKDILE